MHYMTPEITRGNSTMAHQSYDTSAPTRLSILGADSIIVDHGLWRTFIADDLLDLTASTEDLGKTAGKDKEAGKATLVALLGEERARAQAEMLAEQARAHLDGFTERADCLRELAGFVVSRGR